MFVEHKEALEVSETPAKIEKFSTAILVGSCFRPQCSGSYFQDGKSCAIGAAWEAMRMKGRPPASCTETVQKMGFIVPWMTVVEAFHMNDAGKSREEVADWLEAKGY
jgi:hypothetical protein